MIESIITLLIWACVIVAIFWLVVWVLGQLGIPIPSRVIQIAGVILVLLLILYAVRTLGIPTP